MKYNNKVITLFKLKSFIILILCVFFDLPSFSFELKTPLKQGSFFYGHTAPDTTVTVDGKSIPVFKDGHFIAAIGPFSESNASFTVHTKNKTETIVHPITQQNWFEEKVNGLPPEKVTPSKKAQKRIARDTKLLQNARANSDMSYFPTCFQRPVQNFKRISSTFAARRNLNGIKTTAHSGTDYAAITGTPVVAPADGRVKLAHSDLFFSGKTIIIDHGSGIFSSYSHLNDIRVKSGDTVTRGQQIGTVGSTGNSTGPHLHWTLSWYTVRVDPEQTVLDFPCP